MAVIIAIAVIQRVTVDVSGGYMLRLCSKALVLSDIEEQPAINHCLHTGWCRKELMQSVGLVQQRQATSCDPSTYSTL